MKADTVSNYERSRLVGKVIAIAAAAALLVLAADNAFAQNDIVVLKQPGGKILRQENAKIIRETYKEVVFSVGGGGYGHRQMEPTENIIAVTHGNPPHQFGRAEAARKDGDWADAIKRYETAAKQNPKKWAEKYSRFYIGECYRMWARSDSSKTTDAIKAYEFFLSKFTDHRFVPDAHYGKALAAEMAGNKSKAQVSYKELSSGKYGDTWKLTGKFGVGKLTGNKRNLEEVINEADRTRLVGIASAARLILAESLKKQGKTKEAVILYQKAVSNPKEVGKEVLASAHNGLGDCYAKLAADQEGQKKAMFEYLKVVVLYASVRNQYIYALKKSIVLLEKIGGDVNMKRATVLRKELAMAEKG